MRKIILLTLVLLCIVQKNYSYPYYVDRLGVMDGLSNTCVLDIAQDKLGFVWFATEEGLNMLNGNKITSYFKSEANSITGNELNCVLDDPTDSLLWIGTQRSGLNVYDYVNDKFISYHYCPLKIANSSLKLLNYSLLLEIFLRNDLKS